MFDLFALLAVANGSREHRGIDFELVRHTALNRILDVAQYHTRTFNERSVRLTPKALSNVYNSKVEVAEQNEKITESFCDMALMVYNRLVLKVPAVFKLLLDLDEAKGLDNPLDKVSKLHLLVSKAATKEKLEFMIPLMVDLFLNGALSADAFSVRLLKGISTNNKGMCDVVILKQNLLDHLHRWCAEQKFASDVLDTIRKVTGSLESIRQHCGVVGKPKGKLNLAWKAGWMPSADLMLNVFEAVIYNCDYDDVLLNLLKANKQKPAEIFNEPPLSELLEEITDALKAEGEKDEPEDKELTPPHEDDDNMDASETKDAFEQRSEQQGTTT